MPVPMIAGLVGLGIAAVGATVVLWPSADPDPPQPLTADRFTGGAPSVSMFSDRPPAPKVEKPASPARLAASPAAVDFGRARLPAGRSERTIWVSNSGGLPATVSAIRRAGDMAFSLTANCPVLAAGARCPVKVSWAPDRPGAYKGEILVVGGDGAVATVKLAGHASAAQGPAPPPVVVRRPAPLPLPPSPPSAFDLAVAGLVTARRAGTGQASYHRDPPRPGPLRPRYRLADPDYGSLGLDKPTFTYPVDRRRVITEDRSIVAFLENAINSQIPGRVIAVVNRHIYGSDGRLVLLPAGTRFVGSYESLSKVGDTRLAVVWDRILRPDGASVLIEFEAADQMGRTGVIGEVDTRDWDRYRAALLLSVVSAASAFVVPTDNEAAQAAQRDLANNFGQIATRSLEENIDLAPIIQIASGSRVLIVPTRDLWFRTPERLAAVPVRTPAPPQADGSSVMSSALISSFPLGVLLTAGMMLAAAGQTPPRIDGPATPPPQAGSIRALGSTPPAPPVEPPALPVPVGQIRLGLLDEVPVENQARPVGTPVRAQLVEIGAGGGAEGLGRAVVSGTMLTRRQGGFVRATVRWDTVSVEVPGIPAGRREFLGSPLESRFGTAARTIPAGARVYARGDVAGLIAAARRLISQPAVPAETDGQPQQAAAGQQGGRQRAPGGGGGEDDFTLEASSAPARSREERIPVYATTTSGCQPVVDKAAGFVRSQSRVTVDGVPEGECSDDGRNYIIMTSGEGCGDVLDGEVMRPQARSFWTGDDGSTRLLSQCAPDPERAYPIVVTEEGCERKSNPAGTMIEAYARKYYTDANAQRHYLEPCAATGETFAVVEDGSGCGDFLDFLAAVARPQQRRYYTDGEAGVQLSACTPDVSVSWPMTETLDGCPTETDLSSGQVIQFTRLVYTGAGGAENEVRGCADQGAGYAIQKDFGSCNDAVNQASMSVQLLHIAWYADEDGARQDLTLCQADPDDTVPLATDKASCALVHDQAAAEMVQHGRLVYADASAEEIEVQACAPTTERYAVLSAPGGCEAVVDTAAGHAAQQHRRYYADADGITRWIDGVCIDHPTIRYTLYDDASTCSYDTDLGALEAWPQAELVFIDGAGVRNVVEACRRQPGADALPISLVASGCELHHDFEAGESVQYMRAIYDLDGVETVAAGCSGWDSSAVYAHTVATDCAPEIDFTSGFAYDRSKTQITAGVATIDITACMIDEDTASALVETAEGCETIFDHTTAADQSYGYARWYHTLAGAGVRTYVTQCEVDTDQVYAHQLSEPKGWRHDDAGKQSFPLREIYITAHGIDTVIDPARERAGDPAIAYTYVSTATTQTAEFFHSGGYQGICDKWWRTVETDSYTRPDGTDYAAQTGAGDSIDAGDDCVFSEEKTWEEVSSQTDDNWTPYVCGMDCFSYDCYCVRTNTCQRTYKDQYLRLADAHEFLGAAYLGPYYGCGPIYDPCPDTSGDYCGDA